MHTTHQMALENKHAGLEQRIMQEAQRPAPDPQLLADLKKRKLRLKEELNEL